mgnify:FL=1
MKTSGQYITNKFNLVAEGTRYSKEFAAYLKDLFGDILTIVAIPDKLHFLLIRFCITMSRRFAISVTQICILMALALRSIERLILEQSQSKGTWMALALRSIERLIHTNMISPDGYRLIF